MKKQVAAFGLLCSLLLSACHQGDETTPQIASGETINLNVMVKLQVGKYLYENNEAIIVAKGFDAGNNEVWSKEYLFVGPDANMLPIVSGFDHYNISFQKWGVTDSQSFTGEQLRNDRADGDHPVTYGLAGVVPFIKKPIIAHTYSTDVKFPIESRTEYTYSDNGQVKRISYFNDFSSDSASNAPSRYDLFTYDNNGNLSKLTSYDVRTNTTTTEDTYQYGIDNDVVRITEANYSAALTATLDLTVDTQAQQTTAIYQYSNGRGIQYRFKSSWKNLVSSSESNGEELCNTGAFTYDRNINPFRHLDYTSFYLSNNSINNTLTEDVDFIGCAFPTLIPLSYEYKYDDMGYPTEKITHYKNITATSVTKYTYQEFSR